MIKLDALQNTQFQQVRTDGSKMLGPEHIVSHGYK
jgi:hypothetical protein